MNGLETQVYSVPDLYDEVFRKLEEQTHTVLTTPEMYSVKKVFLVGSGDSYAACLAVKNAFEKLLQIPVCVVDPFDLVCYEQMKWVGESPLDPLVIAVSNSGRAARVVEAARYMREHNALTIGVTAHADSPLAEVTERLVDISISKSVKAPGCRSYFVILIALYMIAMRMGTVRLKFLMEDRQRCFDGMKEAMDWLRSNLDAVAEAARGYASAFSSTSAAEVIGSGPDQGTAWYTHAKFYEACGLPCVVSNSENWFHLNYFLRDQKNVPVMIFSSSGNEAESRTKELVTRMCEMGRNFLLVTDCEPDMPLSGRSIMLPAMPFSWLEPVIQWIVPALVASYIAEEKGEVYSRGFEGIWEEGENTFGTVRTKPVRGGENA